MQASLCLDRRALPCTPAIDPDSSIEDAARRTLSPNWSRYDDFIIARIRKARPDSSHAAASSRPSAGHSRSSVTQEIERKYLLKLMPPIPAGAAMLRIRQGYLAAPDSTSGARRDDHGSRQSLPREGRVRETTHQDGRVTFTATIKKGHGLVREEVERDISAEEFRSAWQATGGRQVSKNRYRVPHGELVWEIDDYEQVNLFVAEVELASADQAVEIPDWLAPFVDREVTDDAEYTAYRIAVRVSEGGFTTEAQRTRRKRMDKGMNG